MITYHEIRARTYDNFDNLFFYDMTRESQVRQSVVQKPHSVSDVELVKSSCSLCTSNCRTESRQQSLTFMNFLWDRAFTLIAFIRRRHARSHRRNSNPKSQCGTLSGRFSNRCILLCHNSRVHQLTGWHERRFPRMSGAPKNTST